MAQASARTQARFDRHRAPVLRPVPLTDRQRGPETGGWLDLSRLADLVSAPSTGVAELARAALLPVIAHDALILVTSVSAGTPVQIAAAPSLRDSLAAVEWSRIVGAGGQAPEGQAVRIPLHPAVDGLNTAVWSATTAGCTVWLVIGAQSALEIEDAQERAAKEVAMLTAARARRIDEDPPPGSLAFSRAMSLERERVRAQLSSSYAATLSGVLQTLRSGNDGGSRTAPREVTEAINLASRALLELETLTERHDPFGRVVLSKAFADAQQEVSRVVHAVRLRVFADLDASEDAKVPQAIAQAARFLSRAAALNATRHTGADKLRLLWRLTPATLVITVADNGAESDDSGEELAKLADVQQRLTGLGAEIEHDSRPHWGTTLTCRLPLHDVAATPETPGAKRLDQLRDREREVLELIVAGLRNRDIADRLFISVRTVKYHVSNILQKLDVASRTEAIALAHSAGISARTPDDDLAAAKEGRSD
jgi:DNA-binding CsgD family transcriptional regulator/signal transduction histidine kinase